MLNNWISKLILVVAIILTIKFVVTQIVKIQEEAQYTLRVITYSQIAFFSEESRFADSITELEVGNKVKTNNYDYSIVLKPQSAFSYAIPRHTYLKSYVGGVHINPLSTNQSLDEASNKPQIPTIICEANLTGKNIPELPTVELGILSCSRGTTKVGS